MISSISSHIKQVLSTFSQDDTLIFNNSLYPLDTAHFQPITDPTMSASTVVPAIAFVDGGQAEVLRAGNFCLSFIRIAAFVFCGVVKQAYFKNEFYLFTRAVWRRGDIFYESRIFPLQQKLMEEEDLFLSSHDVAIRTGTERAPVARITSIARRFAELSLASSLPADFIVLDGTLEKTYPREELYLQQLKGNTCALAKSSQLFTILGNSPLVLLNALGPNGCWNYVVTDQTSFVKLHPAAKHVFRVEGNQQCLPWLLSLSSDATFLGYPYPLLLTDRFARVSQQEQRSLKMQFLLRAENKPVREYLSTTNAHDILDSLL